MDGLCCIFLSKNDPNSTEWWFEPSQSLIKSTQFTGADTECSTICLYYLFVWSYFKLTFLSADAFSLTPVLQVIYMGVVLYAPALALNAGESSLL